MAKRAATRRGRQLKQDRSRVTRQRLITAMQTLLEERQYPEITVEQIAAAAHSTTANFYKHFHGKRELLSVIVEQLQSAAEQGFLPLPRSKEFALAKRVKWLVAAVSTATLRRRRIVRACVAARYRADLVLSASQAEQIRATMLQMIDWLFECRDEMDHPNPRVGVRAGTYLTLQGLQNALLFEELPDDIPQHALIAEAERLLLRYLATPMP